MAGYTLIIIAQVTRKRSTNGLWGFDYMGIVGDKYEESFSVFYQPGIEIKNNNS